MIGLFVALMVAATVPASGWDILPPKKGKAIDKEEKAYLYGIPAVSPHKHRRMPNGDPTTIIIRLDRYQCLGSCPDYSVELHGDGSATYQGNRYVTIIGHHTYKVDPKVVRALLSTFRKADFWSLKPSYQAKVTDSAGYKLSLTIGGKTKIVYDYVGRMVGMPKVVTALEKQVDDVAASNSWIVGNDKTFDYLHAEGWDFHSNTAAESLVYAARAASDSFVLRLISEGAPVKDATAEYFSRDETAIIAACSAHRLTIVRALIAAGALECKKPGEPERALIAAAFSGYPSVVAEILKYGANPNGREADDQRTALHVAAEGLNNSKGQDFVGVVKTLLAAHADPNLQDTEGDTPLHNVYEPLIVTVLIEGGAKTEIKNKESKTPLLATTSEDVALALIDAGADVTAKSFNGFTIRDYAKEQKWSKVLTRLDAKMRH